MAKKKEPFGGRKFKKTDKPKGREIGGRIDLEGFIRLSENEEIEGIFHGFTMIKGKQVALIGIQGKIYGLNSHSVLNSKLSLIETGQDVLIRNVGKVTNDRGVSYFDYQIYLQE